MANYHSPHCLVLKGRLSPKEFELWAMVAWSIWNEWNRFYFEASQTPRHAILKSAETFLDEYQRFTRSMPTNWAPECATLTFCDSCILYSFFFLLVVLTVGVWSVGATPSAHLVLLHFINILLSISCKIKKKNKKIKKIYVSNFLSSNMCWAHFR